MIKKKLTAIVAALLICALLVPTTAFAYAPEGEDTVVPSPTAAPDECTESDRIDAPVEVAESDANGAFPYPYNILAALFAGMDPEILEVLREHPKLIAMLFPKLHVTVREGSVTVSIDSQEQKEPGQPGTVTTQGGKLNVRTGPSTNYEIITQLLNGSPVNVLDEKDGWYYIEIPVRYGYVCGDYLKVNEIPSSPEDDGYSFDIDQTMILSFLELLQGMMQPVDNGAASRGLTPSGNLTLVDDLGERNTAGQQFVTLVTKNGNYFYLIIDRDEKGEENVHFLNLVDEQDLFALMEEDEAAAYQSQLVAEQEAREAAERAARETAAASQSGETGSDDQDEEPVKESKKASVAPVLIIILLMAAGGGGWFFLQAKKKKQAASAPDPDADYTDEEEDYGAGPASGYDDSVDEDDPYEVLDDENSPAESEEDV